MNFFVSLNLQRLIRRACLVIAAIVTAALLVAPVRASDALSSGLPAPDWQFTTLEGKTLKSSDFVGKIVLINFWAQGCLPCRAEIPSFIELQKQYGSQGLVVIGVSLEAGKELRLKKFVEREGVNYAMASATEEVAKAFGGIETVPETFIIDRQGRIASRHAGYTTKKKFEKQIQALSN